MNLKPTKPRIYLSHSVRGDGSLTMAENCIRASKVANKIRRVFPEIEVWCPGEKDLTIQILESSGRLSVKNIIWADIEILRSCSNWCWWYSSPSKGCEDEYEEACKVFGEMEENIIYTDLLKANYQDVRRVMSPIVNEAIDRFRKERQ